MAQIVASPFSIHKKGSYTSLAQIVALSCITASRNRFAGVGFSYTEFPAIQESVEQNRRSLPS
jgi:hypothetical protein